MKIHFKHLLSVSLYLLFAQFVYATQADDLYLKTDYYEAYMQYSENLKQEESAQNYLNICKVTVALRNVTEGKNYCKQALNFIEKEKHPDPELRADILSMLGRIYLANYHNSDITFEYLNEAKALKEANPNTDKYELAKLYRYIGYMYNHTSHLSLSEQYYKKALDIIENTDDIKYKVILASIYSDFASKEKKEENYKKEKEYLDKALKENLEAGEYTDNSLTVNFLNRIARYYEDYKHSSKKAEEYYRKAVEYNLKIPNKNLVLQINENLSSYIPEVQEEKPIFSDFEDREEFFEVRKAYLERESDLKEKNKIIEKELLEKYEENPFDIDNNIALGFFYIISDKKNSNTHLRRAENINKNNVYTYINEGYLYVLMNERFEDKVYLEKAKLCLNAALEKGKYYADTYYWVAVVQMRMKRHNDAVKNFKKFIEYSENKFKATDKIQEFFKDNKDQYSI